jgi:hypothetical protein
MDCVHFYHCWADGNWSAPVVEHIEALTSSRFAGPITVGLVGTPANRAEARRVFEQAFPNTRFVEADHGHEEHTLKLVHEHVNQGATGAVLYSHTHGSWHPWGATELDRLTRGLIAGWAHCVDLLADPEIDLVAYVYWITRRVFVGAQERTRSGVNTRGNFWVATCDHLRTLGDIPSGPTVTHQRSANELWVLGGPGNVLRPRWVWPEEPTPADRVPHVPISIRDQMEWRDGAWQWKPEAIVREMIEEGILRPRLARVGAAGLSGPRERGRL